MLGVAGLRQGWWSTQPKDVNLSSTTLFGNSKAWNPLQASATGLQVLHTFTFSSRDNFSCQVLKPLSALKPQLSTLNPQPSTLNPQPATLNPQLSTLIPEPSNSQPSTLESPSTLNAQPSNLHTQPSTINPQPSTLSSQPLNP